MNARVQFVSGILDNAAIKEIESKIDYVFNDKSLLVTAFTHSSYCNEHPGERSYDRLEFLGDSILGFLMAEKLYFDTDDSEGEMTVSRAGSVSKEPLADEVEKLGLIKFLRHGKGFEHDVKSVKTRSDLFESILGAMYVDSGRSMDAPAKFVRKLKVTKTKDYKSILQEYTQQHFGGLKPTYETSEKPNEYGDFSSRAIVGNVMYEFGEGKNKKAAEQKAAETAYIKLTGKKS